MELIVNKYEHWPNITKIISSNENTLDDLVIAYEVGFVEHINKRDFFASHLFCFHCCIDKYNNEININFDIIQPNEQTNTYCYWKYSSNFYKPNEQSKKIAVEQIDMFIKKTKPSFDYQQNECFNIISDKIKEDLKNTYQSVLNFLHNNNINYNPKEMDNFSKKLFENIDLAYIITEESFKNKIITHNYNALNNSLKHNENCIIKKIKI